MSMTTNALACRTIREGIFELIASQPFTHCITLNSDRELSLPRLRGIFGTFCVKIDRQIHVRDHVRNLPIGDRLNAIAFPEHLATNAHLHVLANLAPLEARHPQPQALTECIRRCWLQSSRGAGSVIWTSADPAVSIDTLPKKPTVPTQSTFSLPTTIRIENGRLIAGHTYPRSIAELRPDRRLNTLTTQGHNCQAIRRSFQKCGCLERHSDSGRLGSVSSIRPLHSPSHRNISHPHSRALSTMVFSTTTK